MIRMMKYITMGPVDISMHAPCIQGLGDRGFPLILFPKACLKSTDYKEIMIKMKLNLISSRFQEDI